MKRTALALTLISALFSALVGVQVVKADIIFPSNKTYSSKFLTCTPNVSVTFWDAPPDAITEPTTVIIVSPEENRTYATNNVTLTVNVGIQPGRHYIRSVYYRADWLEKGEQIFYHLAAYEGKTYLIATKISITLNLAGIPDGNHNITVYARDSYGIDTPSTVNFTIDTHLQEDTTPPTVTILSPENKTYNVTDVPWSFTVNESTSWVGYSLDSQTNVTIVGIAILTGLSDGTHSVVFYASDIAGNIGSSEMVYFTVDTTRPNISVLLPQNKTYATTDIQLTFTADETVSWIGYSLDGQANVTIAGNTTLTGLSYGSHRLTVYAKDTAGNTGASETIYFSITQQSAPFPITWIATSAAIIALGGVAILIYFRKIKKTTGKAE